MNINSAWLRENKACNMGNVEEMGYVDQVKDIYIIIEELKKRSRYKDAYWLITRLLDNKKDRTEFAAYSARLALTIFEEKYPNDDRPRKAIEAAEKAIKEDTPENKNADVAYDVAYAAAVAVDVAIAYAADYAADYNVYADIKNKVLEYGVKLLRLN